MSLYVICACAWAMTCGISLARDSVRVRDYAWVVIVTSVLWPCMLLMIIAERLSEWLVKS